MSFGTNYTNSNVTKCYNLASVSGGENIGGIVGRNYDYSICSLSYNSGIISSTSNNIGGITGWNEGFSIVEDCYNIGNVIAEADRAGGIVGDNQTSSNVLNCYNIGDITASSATLMGDIFGRNTDNSTVTNCYYKETDNQTMTEIMSQEVIQLNNLSSALGTNWKIDSKNENNGYPILYWQ